MENIFKKAKFGDRYITKCGKIALFRQQKMGAVVSMFLDGYTRPFKYNIDGTSCDYWKFDIVSRCPVDALYVEEELEEKGFAVLNKSTEDELSEDEKFWFNGYKRGYKQAINDANGYK